MTGRVSEAHREYATVIEVWFEADNPEDAEGVVKRLTQRVLEHPCVLLVEAETAEECDE